MNFESFNKNWLLIIPLIMTSLGSISKAVDVIKFDILHCSRDVNEKYLKHMTESHLFNNNNAKISTVSEGNTNIVVYVYPDKCVVVKRMELDGTVAGFKILPDPEMENEIKNKYSESGNILYASEGRFSLKEHAKDYNFKESIEKNIVTRVYGDGCVLRYTITKGNTGDYLWIKYQH